MKIEVNTVDMTDHGFLAWVFFGISLYLCAHVWLPWLENREELVQLNDPLYRFFGPADYSLAIACFQYFLVICFVAQVLIGGDPGVYPLDFILLVMGSNFWLRCLTIYLTPLAVHDSLIQYRDPIQKQFVPQTPEYLHDLFYSGHISTCVLCGLLCPTLCWGANLTAVCIAWMMIASRIHYSIDIFAAPFFAYGLFSFWHWLYFSI